MDPVKQEFSIPLLERQLVDALGRDAGALERLLSPDHQTTVLGHRLGPALALRATTLGLPVSEHWRDLLRITTVQKMLLEHHLATLGKALAAAKIRWFPIKGFDLGSRAYEQAEERPAGDIDLLVEPSALPKAREVLGKVGWSSRASGPRFERFLADEGYCWQARQPDGAELEVHFRLWGMVPPGYSESIFGQAAPDPSLGGTALRCHPADAYLLAAIHVWMDPPPRPVLAWWDLEKISALDRRGALPGQVVERAVLWGLQLPVLLSAAHAGALWPEGLHDKISNALEPSLRRAERRLFDQARGGGTDGMTLGALSLARLVSRRRSRTGLRAIWRRFWAHPGVVDRETPSSWPWPARRAFYFAKRRGWSDASRWFESRFGGV